VNYTWSIGKHGLKQGGLLLPDMLRWLWRDQPVSTDPRNMEERSFAAAAPKMAGSKTN
jgi:enterochelin esterase family protein